MTLFTDTNDAGSVELPIDVLEGKHGLVSHIQTLASDLWIFLDFEVLAYTEHVLLMESLQNTLLDVPYIFLVSGYGVSLLAVFQILEHF